MQTKPPNPLLRAFRLMAVVLGCEMCSVGVVILLAFGKPEGYELSMGALAGAIFGIVWAVSNGEYDE